MYKTPSKTPLLIYLILFRNEKMQAVFFNEKLVFVINFKNTN